MFLQKWVNQPEMCKRCVLTSSFPRITFDSEGICSVCHEYDRDWNSWRSDLPKKRRFLEKICREAKSKHKDFDAVIPLSGGKDSSYVLYVAAKELGLKCLAYTVNFGYLSDFAKSNIDGMCKKLGIEHVYYNFDQNLANRLLALFVKKTGSFCSVCSKLIAMTTSRVAEMYRVPLIITGTSTRTEMPLTPEMFTFTGSNAFIRNVLKGEPLASECERIFFGSSTRRKFGYLLFLLSGKKRLSSYGWFNLADYWDWTYNTMYDTIGRELDWKAPSEAEHMDCIIHPVSRYIHNRRFPGLEVERLSLARLVMAGQITREEALRRLEAEPRRHDAEAVMRMFLKNLGMEREEFDKCVDLGPRHLQFNPKPSRIMRLAGKVLSIQVHH
jgi:hypothetical protein